jgi:prolyl-tRNA synthetase
LIATHGDDKGLVLPPNIAPTHIVIVPIYTAKDKSKVLSEARKLKAKLKEFSVELDDREEYSPGWKFNEWELKGIPLRIEIGPKDIAMKKVIIVRRDTGEKKRASMAKINVEAKKALDEIQSNLFAKAKKFLDKNITKVKDYDEFKKVLEKKKGFISACWCGSRKCEDTIKDETGAKITNIPFKTKMFCKFCLYCGKKAKYVANFAKSY